MYLLSNKRWLMLYVNVFIRFAPAKQICYLQEVSIIMY